MNLIRKAIDEVRFHIPLPILEMAFITQQPLPYGVRPSLDSRIRELVLDQRVLVDCNLVGGVELTIPLDGLVPERVDNLHALYRIPKERTQGRTILSVLSTALSYGANHGVTSATDQTGFANQSALSNATLGLLNSASPIPLVAQAHVTLVGENTVVVQDHLHLPPGTHLRCLVTNDSELNNINPASYHAFCQLAVLATKAYIYNHLVLPIDESYLVGGVSLGRFREIVDGFADANELYQEHLKERWKVTAFHNDPERHRRHLKLIMGGNY